MVKLNAEEIGLAGELAAIEHLQSHGYALVTHHSLQHRTARFDLEVTMNGEIYPVEVRTTTGIGRPHILYPKMHSLLRLFQERPNLLVVRVRLSATKPSVEVVHFSQLTPDGPFHFSPSAKEIFLNRNLH